MCCFQMVPCDFKLETAQVFRKKIIKKKTEKRKIQDKNIR